VFPIATLIGLFAGRAVGTWFSAPKVGMWVGGALGVAAGFYNLVKVAIELQRREERQAEEDPPPSGEVDPASSNGRLGRS
jgi:hypothetical protein